MREADKHKLLTLNAYNTFVQEFAKNTAALHPQEQARKFLDLLPGNKILDLGCGPGRDAQIFVEQGLCVTGVDFSPKMIEIARSKVAAQFYVMDIEHLDLALQSFHGVWASASLLHIPKNNILRVLKNIYSLLIERGVLYLSLKKGVGEGLQADPRYGDAQKFWSFFEEEEIIDLVREAGFAVIESGVSEKKSAYQGHPLWVTLLCQKRGLNREQVMSFTIQSFEIKYQSEVVDLIKRIQVGEFNIPIEEGQQRELLSIPESFQKNKGNYWVGLLDGKIIGTIAVLDIGHNAFELRDVFLDKEYRGAHTGFARQLLDIVLHWAREHDVSTIYLGTTLAFRAAHRFYEKHGFREISRKEMPSYCQPMDCDEKFYQLDLTSG